jgi:hypothetical protein
LPAEERGSSVYAAYIESQLRDQEARKGSIEQRGVAVITTCGTLVSLLFGLAAVLTGVEEYELPSAAEPWLYAALIAFVMAAITGIVTNLPLFYVGVRVDDLRGAVKNRWNESPQDAEQRVAATQVKVLARAKTLNTVKGFFLLAAIIAEVFAVIFLAVAIRAILLG